MALSIVLSTNGLPRYIELICRPFAGYTRRTRLVILVRQIDSKTLEAVAVPH